MELIKLANGKQLIRDAEHLLAEIEGEDLSAVDISDVRVTADELAELFDIADRTKNVKDIKRYAALKAGFIEKT